MLRVAYAPPHNVGVAVVFLEGNLLLVHLQQRLGTCSSLVGINEERGVLDASECTSVTRENEFACTAFHDMEVRSLHGENCQARGLTMLLSVVPRLGASV